MVYSKSISANVSRLCYRYWRADLQAEEARPTATSYIVSLYPQPVQGVTQLMVPRGSGEVAVYNLLGQKVAAMMTVGNERVVRMVMPEGTAAGTYFLTVKVGEKVVGKEFKYLR